MKKVITNLVRIIIGYCAVLIFYSCETTIDIDLPEKGKKIVINGVFSPDKSINVNISQSLYILDSDGGTPPFINNNALVKLFENNQFIEDLVFVENGNYASNLIPVAGDKYGLKVSVAGLNDAYTETIIPRLIEITSLDTGRTTYFDGIDSYEVFECRVSFSDPADEENYYMIEVLSTGYYFDPLYIVGSDPMMNLFSTYNGKVIFTDGLFNGKKAEIGIMPEWGKFYDGEYTVNLKSISHDYYLYIKSRTLQYEVGNDPFAEPVMVFNNVESGYGILGSYNNDPDTVIVKFN